MDDRERKMRRDKLADPSYKVSLHNTQTTQTLTTHRQTHKLSTASQSEVLACKKHNLKKS